MYARKKHPLTTQPPRSFTQRGNILNTLAGTSSEGHAINLFNYRLLSEEKKSHEDDSYENDILKLYILLPLIKTFFPQPFFKNENILPSPKKDDEVIHRVF